MSDSPVPAPEPDWAQRTTEFIVDKVDSVAAKTATPARMASRGVVYGLVIAVLVPILLVLLVTLTVRILDVYVPGNVYWVYLALGLAFAGVGVALMAKAARA
ncbi:MAG: hypothetical protein OEW42_00340 [Acidimicrobiia bacterium]|nr:hypothetical protein [Acidimicrobiia bacterium]MDH5236246.1 hypothetical protein [Acidimicrobiia bacterium]